MPAGREAGVHSNPIPAMRIPPLAGLRTAAGGAVLLAAVSSAALLVFAPTPTARQSCTCCPEVGSTCVIGDWVRADKYAKLGGGSCIKPVDAG